MQAFPLLPSSFARRSATDWVLGSLGVCVAAVSVSFAVYMVATGPRLRTSAGSFPVFAAFDRRMQDSEARRSPAPPAATALEASKPVSDIDFTPTGSIALAPAAGTGPTHPDLTGLVSGKATQRISNFTVRDVFDGKALVEGGNRLHLVLPGSILEGAGQVLAIRRQGRSWVVETTGGVIEN